MATIDKNPRKNIPHYSIFEQWKNKVILDTGDVKTIDEIIDEVVCNEYVKVVYDWGEPSCWACDKPVIGVYEEKRSKDETIDLSKIWNDAYVKRKLQRCHIKPRTLGGKDAPENMFLMCDKCHSESPDTVNSKNFFRWVYDQRKTHTFGAYKPQIVLERVQDILSRRGLKISVKELSAVVCERDVSYTAFKEYMSQHIETHEFKYSETSLFEGYVDWLVHIYLDVCLESAERHGII